MNKNKKFIDLVIGGPDMSGTSTQVNDIIKYFKKKKIGVRDIRGTEIDALFHAKKFKKYNKDYLNLSEFLESRKVGIAKKSIFLSEAVEYFASSKKSQSFKAASCVKNKSTTYIDSQSAGVWIMEEPTRRGAGQVNRIIEQNMSHYGRETTFVDAAHCHAVYRKDEFLRFRDSFRSNKLVTVRSRSEESACYQVRGKGLAKGISLKEYLKLPGHRFAFGSPPTHLFIVHASKDWTKREYIKTKRERKQGRKLDDYELNVDYQLLVNRRYATNWLDMLYKKGCEMYKSQVPKIYRFNLYNSKEEIRKQMCATLDEILKENNIL